MKVLLVAINARFSHSNPAVYSLKQSLLYTAKELTESVQILEFNINQPLDYILGEVQRSNADLIGISCYIWNRRETLALASQLKKIAPQLIIVFGGPEASSGAVEIMAAVPAIDFILQGEAELCFPQLVSLLSTGGQLQTVSGLVYRDSSAHIQVNPITKPDNLPDLTGLPFPYSPADLDQLQGHIVYYESSRGCPYSCAYCLSSQASGLRLLPLERVKADVLRLVQANVSLVKFVDRTFNCDRARAATIWDFLIHETPADVRFHFEIGADLLDPQSLTLLAEAPAGKFQFEVGVQSTTPSVLEAVSRPDRTKQISKNIQSLAQAGNIHLHLDLIAGLPLETWDSFATSFDEVYQMNPHQIQLGFLKVLPGTPMHRQAQKWELIYQDDPPYEILATPTLSYQNLWQLKRIEELVEAYYNTGRFYETVRYIVKHFFAGSAFSFFANFAEWWTNKGFYQVKHKVSSYYDLINRYLLESHLADLTVIDLLTLDFAVTEQYLDLPAWSRHANLADLKAMHHKIAQDESFRASALGHLTGLKAREVSKKTRLIATGQGISKRLILVDYTRQNPVTGRAHQILLGNCF